VKILALSDQIEPFIYSSQIRERLPEVDAVVGCGDLPAAYLEFVLTALNVPLLYVLGNHDGDWQRVPGGRLIDGHWGTWLGRQWLGLGGSNRYKPDGRNQYTQAEMARRLWGPSLRALIGRLTGRPRLDVLVTHAPPFGIHDGKDEAHTGFTAFLAFMRWARPRLLLHGHQHIQRNLDQTETQYHETTVINVYPYRLLDLPL
jgi:Icc-related predicted phosphoesterase